MLITVLAENSHIRAVGFEGEEIRFHASIQTEPRQTSDYYNLMLTQLFTLYGVSGEHITGVVLASVVPQLTPALTGALARIAGSRHKVLSLSSGVKTGLNIRSDQPQQVGTDRVAAAVGAKARGKLPCVIVDCGTATTFTVLDENGALVASAITAGVELSLEALRTQTAQLPTVALTRGAKYDVMARNTADAMRIGAVLGAAAMVDGLVERLPRQYAAGLADRRLCAAYRTPSLHRLGPHGRPDFRGSAARLEQKPGITFQFVKNFALYSAEKVLRREREE